MKRLFKRQWIALLVALSMCSTSVMAASTGTNFKDVPKESWFAESVNWAVEEEITSGTSANTFSPNVNCNNAQIVTFLWRAYGCPDTATANPFLDVNRGSYYYKAALWAYENNMISGRYFEPEKMCTRSMVVTYLWDLAGSAPVELGKQFVDVNANDSFASAVAWAVDMGIVSGTSSVTFSPNDICTRAQVMTFLYRGKDALGTIGASDVIKDKTKGAVENKTETVETPTEIPTGTLTPVEPNYITEDDDMEIIWK